MSLPWVGTALTSGKSSYLEQDGLAASAGWENVLRAAENTLKTEMTVRNRRWHSLSSLLADKAASAGLIDALAEEAALYGGVNLNLEEFG